MTSWNTQPSAGSYDPKRRYTQASDRKGHYTRIRVKFPTEIGGQLARVVASKAFEEYETPQAIIRDAVVHHLHKLNQTLESEEIERAITLTVLHDEILARKQRRDIFGEMMESIDTECADMQMQGKFYELREYVEELMMRSQAVPKELREEFVSRLERKLKTIGGM